MADQRYILGFRAVNRLYVVIEFGEQGEWDESYKKIEAAGLSVKTLESFEPKFDEVDLYIDMRSWQCRAQFNLDDLIHDDDEDDDDDD